MTRRGKVTRHGTRNTHKTTQMLGVGQKLRHMKGSDTCKTKCFRLFPPFTKSFWIEPAASCPNSRLPLHWGADWCGGLCSDHSRVPGSWAYFKWPHGMAILSYFPHCNSPFRAGFYSPVKIWIIVSTFGFNLLKEGGFVKEMQCKQPPVYTTHCKRQKGLRNGLSLHPLNYRLARPGILSKGSAWQDRKRGSHCGNWWVLWQWPTSSYSHPLCPVGCSHPTWPDHHRDFDYPSSTPSSSPSLFWCDPTTGQLWFPLFSIHQYSYWWQWETMNHP